MGFRSPTFALGIFLSAALLPGCDHAQPPPSSAAKEAGQKERVLNAFLLIREKGGFSGPTLAETGSIAVENECVVLKAKQRVRTVLWPEGTILVRGPDGKPAVRITRDGAYDLIPLERTFQFAGQMLSPEQAKSVSTTRLLPSNCPEELFATAGVRR